MFAIFGPQGIKCLRLRLVDVRRSRLLPTTATVVPCAIVPAALVPSAVVPCIVVPVAVVPSSVVPCIIVPAAIVPSTVVPCALLCLLEPNWGASSAPRYCA